MVGLAKACPNDIGNSLVNIFLHTYVMIALRYIHYNSTYTFVCSLASYTLLAMYLPLLCIPATILVTFRDYKRAQKTDRERL